MKKFFYRVEKGDSVLSISQRFCASLGVIIKLNELKREVEVGDLLYIETSDKTPYVVAPFDTLESLAEKFGVSKECLMEKNRMDYVFYGLKIYL